MFIFEKAATVAAGTRARKIARPMFRSGSKKTRRTTTWFDPHRSEELIVITAGGAGGKSMGSPQPGG